MIKNIKVIVGPWWIWWYDTGQTLHEASDYFNPNQDGVGQICPTHQESDHGGQDGLMFVDIL